MKQEIGELKEMKAAALKDLREVDLSALPLASTDERLEAYVEEVRRNGEMHNLFEVLAIRRFLSFFGKYEWRAKKVRTFIRFYEILKFSGVRGRCSYKLTPIQVFQFASILGFYKDGCRLTREAMLFVPRKFSKTTSTASLAVFELLFGDANAQAYTGANSYKQAQICFKEIQKLVKQLDPGMKNFKTTREHIEWRSTNKMGKESFVECLTGGADTKDGLAASLVIMDEYAQAKYVKDRSVGADLLNVLRSSMGTRKEPLVMIITTASKVPDGPFSLELDSAKRVLMGEYEDDSLFASIFEPDAWDMDHLDDPKVWKKCNPHIGITVLPDFYATNWDRATRDAEQMQEFKTKLLNIFVAEGKQEWIPRRLCEQLTTHFELKEYQNPSDRPDAMAAIDLSVSDDFSAISYNIYSKTLHKFFVWSDYFIPAETLKTHPNRELYEYWVKKGWMHVCEGAVIKSEDIVANVLQRNRQMRILSIGYDAYKSQEVVNSLAATIKKNARKVLTAVPQTYGAFTSPVETFEMAAKRVPAGVALADNPIQVYCLTNAYIDEDKMGNKKPIKRKANLKIDSCITTMMTFWLWNNHKF